MKGEMLKETKYCIETYRDYFIDDKTANLAIDELDQLINENQELKKQLEEQKELVELGEAIRWLMSDEDVALLGDIYQNDDGVIVDFTDIDLYTMRDLYRKQKKDN